jgi:ketosteroid isomerase-like protein
MGRSNAELVRAAYDQLDLDAVGELFAPDAEWFGEEGGDAACHGREEILAVYQQHLEWGAQGEVAEAADAGDQVVLGLRVRYPGHDHDEDDEPDEHPHGEALVYHVLTLSGDKVVRMQDYPDRRSACEAAEPRSSWSKATTRMGRALRRSLSRGFRKRARG